MIDALKLFAAIVAACATLAGAWAAFDLPMPATRSYVQERVATPLHQMNKRLLRAERRLYSAELFQWERNNPPPRSDHVEMTIERLKHEIAEIDRSLAADR